jgi:hypothetical protein
MLIKLIRKLLSYLSCTALMAIVIGLVFNYVIIINLENTYLMMVINYSFAIGFLVLINELFIMNALGIKIFSIIGIIIFIIDGIGAFFNGILYHIPGIIIGILALLFTVINLIYIKLSAQQTPSLPDARPRSDRFRCGGRESNFLAATPRRPSEF